MLILAAAIICAFALYGVFIFAQRASECFREAAPANALKESIVMFVGNQEDSVEGIVRSAAWNEKSQNGGDCRDIVVVDLGSEDETFEILMRLQNEYEFVHAVSRENYIEKIQEMQVW